MKLHGSSKTHKPGPDIQFTSVDYAWELEENGEPSPHPHTVLRRYIHVITRVVFERLPEKKKKKHIHHCTISASGEN